MHTKQDCRAVASLRGAEAPWRNLSKLKDGAITNKEKPSCVFPEITTVTYFVQGSKKISYLLCHFCWIEF